MEAAAGARHPPTVRLRERLNHAACGDRPARGQDRPPPSPPVVRALHRGAHLRAEVLRLFAAAQVIFHLLAPSAIAASRRARGTASKNSSVLRSVIGIIISPSANPPASVEKCLKGSTAKLNAKIPITIDGTPFNKSAAYRTQTPLCSH